MTKNNYVDVLYNKGYVANDGEVGFENWFGGRSVQLYIMPETDTYILSIYDTEDEEAFSRCYSSLQTLTTALKSRGLL